MVSHSPRRITATRVSPDQRNGNRRSETGPRPPSLMSSKAEPLRFVPGRRSSGGTWTDRFHACPARRIHRDRGVKRSQCPSHILGSGTLRWVTAILSQVSGVAGLGSVGAGVWSPGPTFLPNRTAPASARRSQRANRENRATHGPQDQAGRGPQGLAEAANIVAGRENTGGYELFPS